ncbi:RGD1565959 (predicted) [Rattus norvegicus]|uniref:RGD1565959 (Predicted) n=2 Tax=Rattus norvegicus TaxID=10116 RepID=A6JIG7_RAT|nr:uncharacterized protein LOC301230 precursor [Rattus norvegicus]EDM18915.1 RGD1565959 (predicted) [Rattus norvegicus]|eukprot:NP_001100356.1 uncharacterized protein LOC301230 precursor [Rattus norvegicus]
MTKANSTLESDPAVLSTLVTKILVLLALLPRCMEGVSLGANGADSSFCHRGSEQKSAGDQRVERPSLTSFSSRCEHTRSPHRTFRRRKKREPHSHTHTSNRGAHRRLGLLDPAQASSSFQL